MKIYKVFKITIFFGLLFLFASNSNSPVYNTAEENCESMELVEEAVVSVIRVCKFEDSVTFGSCPSGTWELSVIDDCNGIITGNVFATNLHPSPDSGSVYSLPASAPSLQLRTTYTNGGPTSNTPPLNDFFMFHGETHIGTDNNVYNLFRVTVTIPVDIDGSCQPSIGLANIPLGVSMIDPDAGTLYPVGLYSASYEAFSCKVFAETCSHCGENCDGKDPLPVFDGTACGTCNPSECGFSTLIEENNGPQKNEPSALLEKESKSTTPVLDFDKKELFVIQPNPFSNNFSIKNLIEENIEIETEIFDSNGTRIFYSAKSTVGQKQSINISTSSFNPGVYFCKIKTADKVITKKIIKLE